MMETITPRRRLWKSWADGRARQRGFSLTELVVVCVILTSLAAVAFPIAKFTIKRQKEMELRHEGNGEG